MARIPTPMPARPSLSDPWHDRSNRGKLANEVPFRPDLRLRGAAALEAQLLIPEIRSPARAAISAVIANVVYAAARGEDTWVFYSRDWNFYADLPESRATNRFFALTPMRQAVAFLEGQELIEHKKTAPSSTAEYRSRVRASTRLIRLLGPVTASQFIFESAGAIVLRDADGHAIEFNESRDLGRMRRDIAAQNEYLAEFDIRVDHPDVEYDPRGFLFVGDYWINPQRRAFHRVFNGNCSRGGRWYGPFWQGLPSNVRPGLKIDQSETIERDYRACHPRLLCAAAQIDLPFDDPGFDFYVGKGAQRQQTKLAFNIALNASSEREGLAATTERFREEGWTPAHRLAQAAFQRMSEQYPQLTRYYNTGVGLRLQNCDARICARVQRVFRPLGVPCLSVHDSFIVPARQVSTLASVMDEQLLRMISELRRCGL